MLKIYDTNKNYLRTISNYTGLEITKELSNGDKTLKFTYRGKQTDILNEYYIRTQTDEYVVKEVTPQDDGTDYVCKLNLEELEADMLKTFTATNQTVQAAAALALVGTGWLVSTTITKQRSVQQFKKTPLELLYKIRDAFMAEIWFDTLNKVVHFDEHIGQDRGVYFRRELNLKSVDATLDSYDYYTRIHPYGKDDLEIQNGTKNYVENYQYSSKVRTLIWEDSSYEDAEALKEDAIAKLEDLSKPKRSYKADVRDLARLSADYDILAFSLGDTIHITDEPTGIMEKQRIVKLTVYPDDPHKNKVELSNTVLTWEEMQKALKAAADAWEDITQSDGTVDAGYVSGELSSTGVTVKGVAIGDQVGIEVINSAINTNSTVTGMQSTISSHSSSIASNTAAIQTNADEIQAVTARIGTVETTYLKATDARITYATIEHLNATDGNITTLQSEFATLKNADIEDLTANYAFINALDAGVANIETLLAGNAGTGQLQTIVLNAQNATIDSQFAHNLIVNNLTASDIFGQRISTTDFVVGSDSGKLTIDDNTIQIKDNNNRVRIQIGEDGQGNYSFVVYDSTGSGQLFNSTGITASGIADGLIKNAKIANDANISASKLDIQSLFTEMNGSNYTLKSNKIYLDESGQSLNVAFTAMSGDVSNAVSTAEQANATANQALAVIGGISTLDALGASLSNDAHVVHTLPDGSGGNYTDAWSRITVYLGDTPVNADTVFIVNASSGVTGTWNSSTYTYQVTGMSTNDGYVDFEGVYGTGERYLVSKQGNQYTTRNGNKLTIPSGGSHITKRFSLSKAPDGRVGVSYDLQLSTVSVVRDLEGTLAPATITARAVVNDNGTVSNYAGIFVIEESIDGTTYQELYHSQTAEAVKVYTPATTGVKSIKITLKDATDTYTYDYQTVAVLLDADALASVVDGIGTNLDTLSGTVGTQGQALTQAQNAITTHTTKIGTLETSVNGMAQTLLEMETKIDGVVGGNLQFQVTYERGNTNTTLTAHVYETDPETKKQTEVTSQYPDVMFWWIREDEADKLVKLGSGKTKTVANASVGYRGGVSGCFYPYSTAYLTTRSGKTLTTRNSNKFTTYVY